MPQTTLIIGKEFATDVIPFIAQSKKTIDIVVFDWRWYPDQIGSAIQKFNNTIIAKAKNKAKIRVITNCQNTLNILAQNGIKTKQWQSKKLLHTKLMIIDNEMVILGSHNYTMSAFTINYEVSVIIQDKEVVNRLKTYFENLWWL